MDATMTHLILTSHAANGGHGAHGAHGPPTVPRRTDGRRTAGGWRAGGGETAGRRREDGGWAAGGRRADGSWRRADGGRAAAAGRRRTM